MLFELPENPGTFTWRVRKMVELTETLKISWLHPIPQIRLNSQDALLNKQDEIVTKGGEGWMLHRADSLYHSGRGDDLLKLKPWQDAEATVVENLPIFNVYISSFGKPESSTKNSRYWSMSAVF